MPSKKQAVPIEAGFLSQDFRAMSTTSSSTEKSHRSLCSPRAQDLSPIDKNLSMLSCTIHTSTSESIAYIIHLPHRIQPIPAIPLMLNISVLPQILSWFDVTFWGNRLQNFPIPTLTVENLCPLGVNNVPFEFKKTEALSKGYGGPRPTADQASSAEQCLFKGVAVFDVLRPSGKAGLGGQGLRKVISHCHSQLCSAVNWLIRRHHLHF